MDPISDMLTRIRNAYAARLTEAKIPYSKVKLELGKILSERGFIGEVTLDKENRSFTVTLIYKEGTPAVENIKRISKPGLRIYRKAQDLKRVRSGLGISILSTSKGLMTDHEARKRRLGGEVLAEVF